MQRRTRDPGRRRAARILHQLQQRPPPPLPTPPLYPLPASGAAFGAGAVPAYEPLDRHFKIPHGVWLKEATSVAVDSEDNLYVFNRGNTPVLVFDPAGNLLRDFGNATPYAGTEKVAQPFATDAFARPNDPGAGTIAKFRGTEYVRPHMIRIDHEDNLWLIDDMAHTITKTDRSGKRLLVLRPNGVVLREPAEMDAAAGSMAEPPPAQSGRMFNRPTDCCVCPRTGEIFVADGVSEHFWPFSTSITRVCALLLLSVCGDGQHAAAAAAAAVAAAADDDDDDDDDADDADADDNEKSVALRCVQYGNSCVHRFTAEGVHMLSFGESGTDAGQFYCPHNIDMHPDGSGKLLVADRENNRVSVWTVDGEPVADWPAGHRPAGLCVAKKGPVAGLVFVAEQQARMTFAGCESGLPESGSRAFPGTAIPHGSSCGCLSFPFLSFPFLSFPFLSFPFLSFPFLSFPFLS
eukprot:SAG22_NODE_252_length_13679_cov_74.486524_1_plen_462_part_10